MRFWRLAWAMLAALAVLFAWRTEYNHDELEHLHAAWLLSVGQRPFTDFLEQHHPTLWILFQPLFAVVRSPHTSVFIARLFDLGVLAGLLVCLQRLARRLSPDSAPWVTLLAAGSFTFAHNMMFFRPDPLMNALFYAGLLNWVAFLDEKKLSRAAWAGLCFGASIAVLQKALVPVGLVGLAAMVLIARRRPLLRGGLVTVGTSLLPLALLGIWVAAHGLWRDFWFWNYPFNRFFYTQATLSQQFSIRDNLWRAVSENPALWIFGLAGILFWLRRRDDLRFTLLVVLVGYVGLLAFNKFPFQQYFIVFLPLLALFAADIYRLAPLATRLLTVAMMALALWKFAEVPSNTSQRAVQDYVLAHTRPDETIYVSPPFHPLFRQDASHFWYNGALIGDACAAYDRLHPGVIDRRLIDDEKWRARPPSLVFLDPKFPSYHPYRWADHAPGYRESEVPNLYISR